MLQLKDSRTKAGIPGAVLALFDSDANLINRLTANGNGEIDTSSLYYDFTISFVGADADGFADATYSADYARNNSIIYMERLIPGVVPKTSGTKAAIPKNQQINTIAVVKDKYLPVAVLLAALLVITNIKKL